MRSLPNWLTASRVLMALIFFACLTVWRFDPGLVAGGGVDWLLLGAAGLFVIAVLTDALDGYLARRWATESMFGRIMDPFADKLLVVGAFVFLAGPDFWWAAPTPHHFIAGEGIQVSCVYPWMVVVILGRELLVTSIRGAMEAQGISFASDWWGKIKMILQSVMIPSVLVILAVFPTLPTFAADGRALWPMAHQVIMVLVLVTLGATLISGGPYVRRCFVVLGDWRKAKRERNHAGAGGAGSSAHALGSLDDEDRA
jgi:CDP-diacylglycerol--glycerol-3-phosphate 3-phosphatidyltransferase